MSNKGIGIRETDDGRIAFDLPDAGMTIEMEVEQALDFASKIGEVCYIATSKQGKSIVFDQGGNPRIVHESVLESIEAGMEVVVGGQVIRQPSPDDTGAGGEFGGAGASGGFDSGDNSASSGFDGGGASGDSGSSGGDSASGD